MDLWIPSSIKPEKVQWNFKNGWTIHRNMLNKNIIQDRVNSLYPNLAEPKTLYILNVSPERIITLKISPLAPPESIIPAKLCPICHEGFRCETYITL